MRDRFSIITVAIAAAAASAVISVSVTQTQAQAPAASGTAPKTAWGEPDLQGIWTDESDTPMQRPAKYANQEFFTEAQRAELDRLRSELPSRDRRAERGTEADVAGAYNAVFTPMKRTGARTSRIVDPPNGRLPPLTPEIQKLAAAERAFRVRRLAEAAAFLEELARCNLHLLLPLASSRLCENPKIAPADRIRRRPSCHVRNVLDAELPLSLANTFHLGTGGCGIPLSQQLSPRILLKWKNR